MSSKNLTLRRIATDAAGYGLILLGVATGWLPGPGGIPLILAGLGLLSIYNKWAKDLRKYVITHSSTWLKQIFPDNPLVQWTYDVLVIAILAVVTYLAWQHAAIWQLSLATALFFIALFIASVNRDRFKRAKHKITKA